MEQQDQPLFDFPVETPTQRNLLSAGGWARFIGIIGFIFLGLLVIVLVVAISRPGGAGSMTSTLEEILPGDLIGLAGMLIVVILVLFAIIGTLSYLLIRGAGLIKKGIYTQNQATFNSGLASYRTFFIVYGILSVLSLIFNIIELF